MVFLNALTKGDGNYIYDTRCRRPKKFLFDVGAYDISVHKKLYSDSMYHVAVWHKNKKVGVVDLLCYFEDARTVFSVDTKINNGYQGLGIAYRVYEGLVELGNVAITSNNQSVGAAKLWCRFASNKNLQLYFVDGSYNRLFESDIYEVRVNKKDRLEGVDYRAKVFDPYDRVGNLLLIQRNRALHKTIQRYIPIKQTVRKMTQQFKRFDKIKI